MVLSQIFRESSNTDHRLEPMASITSPPSSPWLRAHRGLALLTSPPQSDAACLNT